MKRYEYTPDPMLSLEINEVFVFGANTLGHHGGGSANAAHKFYGAMWGEIHRTGRCYGLVTLNFPTGQPLTTMASPPSKISQIELEKEFELFFKATLCEPEKIFYLTKVGLGIAGWKLENVKEAFWKHYDTARHLNVIIPVEFEL